jgi:hypothetical protein
VVCVGRDAWRRVNGWNAAPNGVPAIILPAGTDPRAFAWPVHGQLIVIEAACGPSDGALRDLEAVLLAYRDETVRAYPATV